MVYNKYAGNDNYGKPKQQYLDRLASMEDDGKENPNAHKDWKSLNLKEGSKVRIEINTEDN